ADNPITQTTVFHARMWALVSPKLWLPLKAKKQT
ncbi:MAG: hypothetical protein ACI9VX_002407, partial [Dinoroseobacter sp.]